MNRNRVWRSIVLAVASAAIANAQVVTGAPGSGGPADALWAIARLVLGCVGAILTIAVIYHAAMGALADRDHFAKIAHIALYGGVAFFAYGIVTLIQNGSIKVF